MGLALNTHRRSRKEKFNICRVLIRDILHTRLTISGRILGSVLIHQKSIKIYFQSNPA